MSDTLAAGLASGLGLVFVGPFAGLVARLTRARQLDRNGAVGIRTSATKASDCAWYAGHDAARPWLIAVCWWAVGGAGALIVAGVLYDRAGTSSLPLWIIAVPYAAVLGALLMASYVASKAATAAGDPPVHHTQP